jgi:ubiquinone biosynthesis protein
MLDLLLALLFFLYRILKIFLLTFLLLIRLIFSSFLSNEHRTLKRALYFRQFLADSGGAAIKIGQILSTRHDLFSTVFCDTLSALLDKATPFSARTFRKIIRKEYGTAHLKFFKLISEKPIASASLAQVHFAITQQDAEVVLKIQRPFIRYIIWSDILLIKIVRIFLLMTGIGARIGIPRLLNEISQVLKTEIDYSREITVLQLMEIASKSINNLRTPVVYKEYCTPRIICMEYFTGTWISDIIRNIRRLNSDEDYREDAVKIFTIIMDLIFKNGLFHADPHAGNLVILPNNEIGFVDFGQLGVLDEDMRNKQIKYLYALSKGNVSKAIEYYLEILIPNKGADFFSLKQELGFMLEVWVKKNESTTATPKEKSSGTLLLQTINLARKYKFSLPQNLVLFYKTLIILEPTMLELYPGYNAVKETKIYFNEYYRQKFLDEIDQKFNLVDLYIQVSNGIDTLREIQKRNLLKEGFAIVEKSFSFILFFARLSLTTAIIILVAKIFYNYDLVKAIPFMGIFDYKLGLIVLLFLWVQLIRRQNQ